jgi:hypothetical protein
VDKIAPWRAGLSEDKRYRAMRSLRQVLAAAGQSAVECAHNAKTSPNKPASAIS